MESKIIAMIENAKVKQDLLQKLYDLTQNQQEAIEKEEMTDLTSLYEKKEIMISAINKLDSAFVSLLAEVKQEGKVSALDALDKKKYPGLKDLKKVVSEIEEISQHIYDLETENQRCLSQKVAATKEKLKKGKNGKRAVDAYGRQHTIEGELFINKRK